jgi:succinoglycan biosynthesis transport protein ExoP
MDSGSLIPSNNNGITENRGAFALDYCQPAGQNLNNFLPPQESMLRDYLRVLIKRRWFVLGTMAAVFSVVAVATLRSTRIYDASGSIAINKSDAMAMNFGNSANGAPGYYDTSDVDTEVRVLQSDLLALDVIRRLNLDQLPEFGGKGAKADSALEEANDSLQPDSPQTSPALLTFKSGLNVTLVPNSRIIEIHYRSPNRELAAKIVNALMDSYVEQNFKTKFDSTMQISDWLTKQLVDLQIKVETSEQKLVKYQKDHNILGIDEKQNIVTSKLDELNKSLTAAESERMQKESIYKLVQSSDPATAASTALQILGERAGSNISGLLEKLRSQHADLKIQIALMSTQFGPSFPKVVQLTSQLKEVDDQIKAEMDKILDQVKGDYMASAQHENLLKDAMENQKDEANKLNENAIEYSLLKRDVDTNRTLYEGLLEKLKEAGVSAGLHSNNFRVVDRARPPSSPAEPNIPRNLAFALALGLTSGLGLAFLMEGLDSTVHTPEQAQAVSGLPSLGMIPLGSLGDNLPGAKSTLTTSSSREYVELVTQGRPQSQMAESYRALRTSLLLSSIGAPPKVILVTSALPQEGKTTTSMNTSIVLAQKGGKVLIIDADLRRPSIHKALGMGPRTGLSNVLTGSASLEQAVVQSSILPSLYVLPAGTPPPNPAELLASSQMREILAKLREQYDHIVIDTPPTLSVTDAVIMSTNADTVVLVIRSGQTTKQALRRARDLLMRVNARVAGVLLNAADLKSADYYYYYEYRGEYGNRYYRGDDATTPREDEDTEETQQAASKTAGKA